MATAELALIPDQESDTFTRGRAFGIDISSAIPLPIGCDGRGPQRASRATRLELTSSRALDRQWRPREAEVLVDSRWNGRLMLEIERHPELGYRIYAPRFGRHHVAGSGRTIHSALPKVSDWRWQRLLFAQALPLAATLQGIEALHASGIELGGRAFAFTAASGTGKTSLAMHMLARGATLLTDDVLAVELLGDDVLAHPGAATLSAAPAELAAIEPGQRRRLGQVLGRIEKVQLRPPISQQPCVLRAMYFLHREPSHGRVLIEPLEPNPGLLLSTTFIPYVTTPERLLNQIDVHSRIARSVSLFKVRSPANAGAAELARAVEAHVETLP